jgi:hypothetical protein
VNIIKTIIKIGIVICLLLGFLWIGGYSWDSFSRKVELKDPVETLSPVGLPDFPTATDTNSTFDFTANNEITTEATTAIDIEPKDNNKENTKDNNKEITTENSKKSNVELSYTKSYKLTIDGKTIELSSTSTIGLVKWLTQNTTDNSVVVAEEIKTDVDYSQTVLTSKEELNNIINSITIKDIKDLDGYKREEFEKPTHSYELNNKKENRNDYAWKTSKWLISEEPFEYSCPYTGETITDEKSLDYDHIVPLGAVYDRGGKDWTNEEKNEYAYDQWVGVDVLNKANRSKSDKSPTEYLPTINVEDYCYSWLLICSKYNLAMSEEEINICKDNIIIALDNGETVEFLGGKYESKNQ